MDIERFRALLAEPRRTQQDLVTMRDNALRVSAVEHIHAAEAALDARFPSWRVVRSRRGGATIGERALKFFVQLYDVEREVRELDAAHRKRIRQEQARPVSLRLTAVRAIA